MKQNATSALNKFRLSRYVTDFDELQLQPPSSHLGQVVSKVRHKIDLNIYAIKRIQWPHCPLVLSNIKIDPNTLPLSGSPSAVELSALWSIEDLEGFQSPPEVSTAYSQPFVSSDLSHDFSIASFGMLEPIVAAACPSSTNTIPSTYQTTRDLLNSSICDASTFVKSQFQSFSLSLYRRLMLEISRLSRLQHSCIGRVLQGWIQKANPMGNECKAMKQPIFFATLPPHLLSVQNCLDIPHSQSIPIFNKHLQSSNSLLDHVISPISPTLPSLPSFIQSVPLTSTLSRTRTRLRGHATHPWVSSLDSLTFPLFFSSTPHSDSSSNDRNFCVQMEFCSSPTLRTWIDRGRLGPRDMRRVWALFRQVRNQSLLYSQSLTF